MGGGYRKLSAADLAAVLRRDAASIVLVHVGVRGAGRPRGAPICTAVTLDVGGDAGAGARLPKTPPDVELALPIVDRIIYRSREFCDEVVVYTDNVTEAEKAVAKQLLARLLKVIKTDPLVRGVGYLASYVEFSEAFPELLCGGVDAAGGAAQAAALLPAPAAPQRAPSSDPPGEACPKASKTGITTSIKTHHHGAPPNPDFGPSPPGDSGSDSDDAGVDGALIRPVVLEYERPLVVGKRGNGRVVAYTKARAGKRNGVRGMDGSREHEVPGEGGSRDPQSNPTTGGGDGDRRGTVCSPLAAAWGVPPSGSEDAHAPPLKSALKRMQRVAPSQRTDLETRGGRCVPPAVALGRGMEAAPKAAPGTTATPPRAPPPASCALGASSGAAVATAAPSAPTSFMCTPGSSVGPETHSERGDGGGGGSHAGGCVASVLVSSFADAGSSGTSANEGDGDGDRDRDETLAASTREASGSSSSASVGYTESTLSVMTSSFGSSATTALAAATAADADADPTHAAAGDGAASASPASVHVRGGGLSGLPSPLLFPFSGGPAVAFLEPSGVVSRPEPRGLSVVVSELAFGPPPPAEPAPLLHGGGGGPAAPRGPWLRRLARAAAAAEEGPNVTASQVISETTGCAPPTSRADEAEGVGNAVPGRRPSPARWSHETLYGAVNGTTPPARGVDIVELPHALAATAALTLDARRRAAHDVVFRRLNQSMTMSALVCPAPARIVDGLYLGNAQNAACHKQLTGLGVTHVVNISVEVAELYPEKYRYTTVRLQDCARHAPALAASFDSICQVMHAARAAGGVVFVHCLVGASRSCAVVAAYLMAYLRWSLDGALSHLQERRPILNLNAGLRRALEGYAAELVARAVNESLTC